MNETDLSKEILTLKQEGMEAALSGRSVSVSRLEDDVPLLLIDPARTTTEDFLKAVSSGAIEVRGGTRKNNEHDLQLFLHEATQEFGTPNPPAFLKSVASAWARLSASRATEDVTRRMARATAKKFSELWRLGGAASIPVSVMEVSLHRIDLYAHIRAMGWLEGEISRLRSQIHEEPRLFFLEKNRLTILVKALKNDDPRYPQKVSQSLPRMIDALGSLVARMRSSSDSSVQEAAKHLGGIPGTKRKGNISSLINCAIASGRLLDYVREVESRFVGGDIVKEIESAIRKLGGNTEKARLLKANKASLISRSIHHGTLDYRPKWEKKLKTVGGKNTERIQTLESENQRLRSLVAELMLTRRT